MKFYFVYILRYRDNSLYTGITNDLDRRVNEHNDGKLPNAYTFTRRRVILEWYQEFTSPNEAIYFEKKLKRWSKLKKEALIKGEFELLQTLSECRNATHSDYNPTSPSTALRVTKTITMNKKYRIGQIVPSSNVTMETEIPAIFRARETILPERFTFHSSRMRMKKVTKEELEAMDAMSLKCAQELSDAHVDVMGYACLVAIMSMGRGYHCVSEVNLHQETVANDFPTPIVTSAGALINGLKVLGAKQISIITPYMRPLTDMVVDYIEHQGIKVKQSIALEIPDNLEVAAQNPMNLLEIYKQLDLTDVDVLVASACVQMPSLEAIDLIQAECCIPVTSAAVCTTYEMMKKLGIKAKSAIGGELLNGNY